MNQAEFSKIRQILGKTQKEMACLLGISKKSVESFEQGWRKIPAHVERHSLFLLSRKIGSNEAQRLCWEVHSCPEEIRHKCPAWEMKMGHLCWFVNGTRCHGEIQKSWEKKMEVCRHCDALQSMLKLL